MAAASAADLVMRSNCERCGAPGGVSGDLFASACRHMTLCVNCGKDMAESSTPCPECHVPVKKLIKEFKVKKSSSTAKQFFVGRFPGGWPPLSGKSGVHWTMRKDVPRPGDRMKAKPWILEDDTGTHQFQGQLEGGQQATYYFFIKHGREFHAMPVGSWFNFHKVVQYKQLTLEEAEEQMKNRRKTADGYQRWMMRTSNGAEGGSKKAAGEEDAPGNKKKPAKPDDEDEDIVKPEDFDDDEPVERGDDWEHEETFTDDDEAVAIDPEEREDQGPDVPAPPEIKQEEEENEDGQTQDGGLSQSGRDMKKLLGKSTGMDESEGEEDEEDEDMDPDNEDLSSPVLAPKTAAEESKPSVAKNVAAASSKGKRKSDETKPSNPSKKGKVESKKEPASVKKETGKKESVAKPDAAASGASGPVTEEELKAVLKQSGPVRSQVLVSKFKSRLQRPEEKTAFAEILKKISRIQKKDDGSYIVLK